MPVSIRFTDLHLNYLTSRAKDEPALSGELSIKDTDHSSQRWHKRWTILHQNLLLYFENSSCTKPVGIIFLEHSTVDLVSLAKLRDIPKQHTFYIAIPEDSEQQKYFLRASSEDECNKWVNALRSCSYASLQLENKQLEAKYNLSTQILEAEQEAKEQLINQCMEYDQHIQSLESNLAKKRRQEETNKQVENQEDETESNDIKKIKKVQSLVRAWLCRRRWHSVVQNYIESGHASSIRQRNQVIFHFVQEEEEYVTDLSTLVTSFLRPFRMAASARKPPTSHEEVNSIFLNCEIILFLHQIFLKGLHTRMENWPTLILGDLFRILLPMYGIYQEYVRNHHYSLQMLAECKKHSLSFNRLLTIHEEKPACANRSLETFLTLPMHRVPGYIITLHRLLAFTPPDHVDRQSLEHARGVLEELSLLMHDEVSETENIRKNLSIERQIVGGCEELLDVKQVFIRQGSLIQVEESHKKPILSFAGLGLKPHERKEYVRHCFLFSGLLLIATRSSNGKLSLHKSTGKLHLSNVSVIENLFEEDIIFDVSTPTTKIDQHCGYADMALRVVVHPRDGETPLTITLVAQTAHEKAAWLGDLKQCIENMTLIDNVQDTSFSSRYCFTNVRNDPSLYTDDVGIKYSKCLNSCRIPRIRYASLKRLFERLLDLRFLSIEFLNTFLITYRIFTDADTILDVLEKFYNDRQRSCSLPVTGGDIHHITTNRRVNSLNEKCSTRNCAPVKNHTGLNEESIEDDEEPLARPTTLQLPQSCYHRRHSSPSALGEGHVFQYPNLDTSTNSTDSELDGRNDSEALFASGLKRSRSRVNSGPSKGREDSDSNLGSKTWPRESQYSSQGNSLSQIHCTSQGKSLSHEGNGQVSEVSGIRERKSRRGSEIAVEPIPVITMDCSLGNNVTSENIDTLNQTSVLEIDANNNPSPKSSSSSIVSEHCLNNVSSGNIVKTTRGRSGQSDNLLKERQNKDRSIYEGIKDSNHSYVKEISVQQNNIKDKKHSKSVMNSCGFSLGLERSKELPDKRPNSCPKTVGKQKPDYLKTTSQENPSPKHSKARSQSLLERRKGGKEAKYGLSSSGELKPKRKFSFPRPLSPRLNSSSPKPVASPGAVVTSARASRRRTSITAAAAAFAAATAGAPCSPSSPLPSSNARFSFREVQGPLARVLTVLHHWLIKHGQDFRNVLALQSRLKTFIDKVKRCEKTTSEQRRFCNTILQTLDKDPSRATDEKLFERIFLRRIQTPSELGLTFDKVSSSQLAEQLTLTEHLLFSRIPSFEFLNLSWMKADKEVRAPNILRVSQRFNEVSRLVASEILSRSTASSRAAAIEKWVVVADVCRHLCNFNAVLEIVSALMSSSVFRLKKTWEKLSKQTKAMIDKLQDLVSTDGRFKNMREALRCSNPPCIPYLGFYLTDLAFIEEGTSVKNESGLINFSKMRMIAQVVEEIRQYQEIRYNIQHDSRVTDYLFNREMLMDENSLYKTSLTWEPKKRPSVRLKKADSQD
ncbi:ras-specific guanine nucleotide-releasing factor 2-like [Dendronephthya gigantea]|uniref:ras-specific guanine nucleotide-releasing factor 2-like n=1 Tax=Dendronephthya gigantea TaxID=151771 RepID=UPI00106B49B1|nr:ras-specific guanine nucleotide-releasing factor 2-like [Dendronephthya gigantea]